MHVHLYEWTHSRHLNTHVSNKATGLTCPYLLQPFAVKIMLSAVPQQLPTRSTEEIKLLQRISYFPLARSLCSLMAFFSDELSPTLIKLWEYLNFPIEICQDVKTSFPLLLHHHFKTISSAERMNSKPRLSCAGECHGLQIVPSIQRVDPA